MKNVDWFGVFVMSIIAAATALLGYLIAATPGWERSRVALENAYLVAHKCQVAGYAGKNATPFYQCDNGLIRRQDIQ